MGPTTADQLISLQCNMQQAADRHAQHMRLLAVAELTMVMHDPRTGHVMAE